MPIGPDFLLTTDELLIRQLHAAQVDDGVVTRRLFKPTADDKGSLSVDRASIRTAKEAFLIYRSTRAEKACGSYGVTVGELLGIGLSSYGDPVTYKAATSEHCEVLANPAHAIVDFAAATGMDKGKINDLASDLLALALERRRLFPDP